MSPSTDRLFNFVGGSSGPWRIEQCLAIAGEGLPTASMLSIAPATRPISCDDAAWVLKGITSNERYVERAEKLALMSRQEGLGRPASTCAALIPIRKAASWWALPQDERRHILEAQSRHIAIGLRYLPGVARRLHHCRDLGAEQPFDFLTWFEFAPSEVNAFGELLHALRESPEWKYVEREVDLRLTREGP